MVNHARTLLLNTAAKESNAPAYYMREWIDPEFVPVTLTTGLQTIRSILFDKNPDELLLNYRARQYMKCLHACELEEYVTQLDSRITYYTEHFSFFKPFITWTPQRHGTTTTKSTDFSIVGDYTAPVSGRMHRQWEISFEDKNTFVASINNGQTRLTTTGSVSYTDGRSEPLQLPGTDLKFTVSELPLTVDINNQAKVVLDAVAEPATTLSDVLIRLQQTPSAVRQELFNNFSEEQPWVTFRNCFEAHYNPIMRLSAAVIAYIYKLEQLR